MRNGVRCEQQATYKCRLDGPTVALFIVKYPADDRAFWSLIGLSPGLPGRGWGKRFWQAMARYHRSRGFDTIETSISFHETSVLNRYVKLGFRFPPPRATFHWVRP